MRRVLVLIAIAAAGAMWYLAGREAGPTITINSPQKFVGRATPFSFSIALVSTTPLGVTSWGFCAVFLEILSTTSTWVL